MFWTCLGMLSHCYRLQPEWKQNNARVIQRWSAGRKKKVGQTARQTDTLTEIDNSKAKISNIKKYFSNSIFSKLLL